MLQLNDQYDIDFNRTKKEVLKYIDEYNFLLALKPTRNEPSTTQSFSFIAPATDRTLHAIESAADKNIKRQKLMKKRERVIKKFENTINKLSATYKYIIVHIYLKENADSDIDVYMHLNLSKTNYYKVKKAALIQLAFFLEIEVYK